MFLSIIGLCVSVAAYSRQTHALELPPAKGMNAGFDVDIDFESLDFDNNLNSTLTSASDHGLDMSTAVSTDDAKCMVSSYSFIVPRGYHSYGEVDTNVCNTITHANNAGFKTKDAYLFPCPTCSKSAATQVTELVDYLNANCPNHWSGGLWLDVEGTEYWPNHADSQEFYEHLVNSCKNKAKSHCGIYTSSSQWSAIFGSSSYKYGNDLPLWYAHYDGNANFNDFTSFGGWSKPHAKQYAGTSTVCGTGVDKNYSPSF